MKLSFWCTKVLLVIAVTASQQQQVVATKELRHGDSKEELELGQAVEGYLRGNNRNLKKKSNSKSKSKSKSAGGGGGGGNSKDAVESRVGSGTGTGTGVNFDYSGTTPITYQCYVGDEWADSQGITCANYDKALCITAAHRTTSTGGIATQSCCICSGGTPGVPATHAAGNTQNGKDVDDRVGAVIVPGNSVVVGGGGGNNSGGGSSCIANGELCVKGQTCQTCCSGKFTNTYIGPELGRCF